MFVVWWVVFFARISDMELVVVVYCLFIFLIYIFIVNLLILFLKAVVNSGVLGWYNV